VIADDGLEALAGCGKTPGEFAIHGAADAQAAHDSAAPAVDPDCALRTDVEQTKSVTNATVYSGNQEQGNQVQSAD
jgi:hypothetical protein